MNQILVVAYMQDIQLKQHQWPSKYLPQEPDTLEQNYIKLRYYQEHHFKSTLV